MAELHANKMHSRIVPKTGKRMVIIKKIFKPLTKSLCTKQKGKFLIYKKKSNNMQQCIKILLFHRLLKSQHVSSGTPLIIRSSKLYLQLLVYIRMWFPLRLDYGRSPHAYVNQRLQIQLELLMMSGVPPLMNGGVINCVTRLHLVGCFY
jgi:hypothetical protein